MKIRTKAGANWLRGEGTFRVKCSREVTESLIISQKGGVC